MDELSLSPMRTSRPVLLYDELSPMSRSCLMLIELARLDVDIRFIDLTRGENFREEFVLLNPTLTVPILVHDNQVTIGSAILFYLCDCTCSRVAKEIYPNDNCTRIQILNRLFFESSMLSRRHSDVMTELMSKTYLEPDLQRESKKIYHMYDVLETYLCGSNYMVGDSVTIADIAILSTLLGLDLIFPICCMENSWPRLSKWLATVSTLRGFNHIQKGVDRQRWVVETAGQFQFSTIRMSPDMQRCHGNNMRCQKEYSGNSKKPSLSENINGDQLLQNGLIVIPPMTDELVSPNSTIIAQQGPYLCCEYNYPCSSEQEQQQTCNIKSIIATANKPKNCNCVRIFEDIGCDTGLPPTMAPRDLNECAKNHSGNLSEDSMRKDRRMNSKKNSKNLSEVSVIPVSELPCYSTCDACDCSFKPLPTDRPLMPPDKNQIKRLDQENISSGDLSYTKQTQACESVCRNCTCKPENALCAVMAPCENSAQPSERREYPTKSISSELFQRVQRQTAYNTDQNCMPLRTNQLNKNSDSMFSFNTNLFQNNMCRQDHPYRKQVPPSADSTFNNFHMYERPSFCCPMRNYNRADDSTYLNYSMPSEVISLSYPNALGNDPESEFIRRSSHPSRLDSMYPMVGSAFVNGRTCSTPHQYAHGYPQMSMNENAPFNNMRPRGCGTHSESCPLHFRGHDGLNNQECGLNMMAETECCASQVRNQLRTSYPTDYNGISNSNRRELPSFRKRSMKPTPPPPPPPPPSSPPPLTPPPPPPSPSSTNGCGCDKGNANALANLHMPEQQSTLLVLNDDTIDQIKAAAEDSPNIDERALANVSEDPKTTIEKDNKMNSDDLKSSHEIHKESSDTENKYPEHQIRISVLVQEQHEHHKRSTIFKEQSEHEKRSPVSEEQSKQEKPLRLLEEQSEEEKRSRVSGEQSEQEKQSPVSGEQSEQENRSSVSGQQSEHDKLSAVPQDQNESLSRRESRPSIGLYMSGHRMSCSRRNMESQHNISPTDNHPQ